jgi:hypothetical protein
MWTRSRDAYDHGLGDQLQAQNGRVQETERSQKVL